VIKCRLKVLHYIENFIQLPSNFGLHRSELFFYDKFCIVVIKSSFVLGCKTYTNYHQTYFQSKIKREKVICIANVNKYYTNILLLFLKSGYKGGLM